ncbi:small-conductance mechanosensitive channel [Microscilla marina ATCC 23134]|uniref:Small-conductance mechanosensitive channel n=2 Tax=Microscilla marina TaxID=1027 RepID=A1ZEZ0_MICM2|nr:small-conductance mechanosensitive channel [Microscilla marina ATCC 23134]
MHIRHITIIQNDTASMSILANFQDFLNYTPIPGYKDLTVSRILVDLFVLIIIYASARLLISITKRLLERRLAKVKSIDSGKRFAILQITKYVIYTIAISIMLNRLHIGSAIFAGSTALFVGIGFGLQQIANDLISGLIILFEGRVKVGDMVEMHSTVGRINSIGIRTSTVETRDSIEIIVPNSKFISDNVINWSSNHSAATRFQITVGVAYGSNVELVKEKLIQSAYAHQDIVIDTELHPKLEKPYVLFKDFGDNSLNFELHFWTANTWDIEIVKSDLRFIIDQLFREVSITIAFPQRDVHLTVDNENVNKLKQVFANK